MCLVYSCLYARWICLTYEYELSGRIIVYECYITSFRGIKMLKKIKILLAANNTNEMTLTCLVFKFHTNYTYIHIYNA